MTASAIRGVAVLGVAGPLIDVVEDLDRAVQLALSDEPRGVVCDLSAVLGSAEAVAVELLARAGRNVRDWPGIPICVTCPEPELREALRAHPLGKYLIATDSLLSAVAAVLERPALTVETLRLERDPNAPRAARDFVTRTLRGWQLEPVTPLATLVVSELVTSSLISAGTDMGLCVVWDRGGLRLTVRDHGPARAGQPQSDPDLHPRGLSVVAGLSRAFGILPAADGGKAVWSVLDASRRPPETGGHRPANERQEALIRSDARARAEQGSSQIEEGGQR